MAVILLLIRTSVARLFPVNVVKLWLGHGINENLSFICKYISLIKRFIQYIGYDNRD